ncbi:MAG: hypothetical protein IPQ23_22545 [Cytophagaceae bacterium]|nr:hypothetical protein [Cytophagaceae bacterium]
MNGILNQPKLSMPPTRGDERTCCFTGPRTELGRSRSSLNRVAHGIKSVALVLPGESVADYRRHADGWFATLPCASPAEAHVVFQLADLAWRQRRLLRLEHAHHLSLVEDAMRKTPQHQDYSSALGALTAINVLVQHAMAAVELKPFPAHLGQLKPFILGAKGTVSIVREVEALDGRLVKNLEEAIIGLEEAAEDGKAKSDNMVALAAGAQDVQAALAIMVKRGEQAIDQLRKKISAETVVPDGPETKKLSRYRAEIEKSQARLLAILDQLRTQRKAAEAALAENGGKSIDVRLRVVR